MDQGQYYPGQPLPVAYGIPSGLPSAKSEEDRLREEVARLKSENAELRGEDDEELAPLGGGPPKKRGRPAKDDGQRPKKGGRPPQWALSEGQKPPAGGDDAPKGKGTHSRRPKKAEGAKKPRGAPTSEYHGVSAAPSKKNLASRTLAVFPKTTTVFRKRTNHVEFVATTLQSRLEMPPSWSRSW